MRSPLRPSAFVLSATVLYAGCMSPGLREPPRAMIEVSATITAAAPAPAAPPAPADEVWFRSYDHPERFVTINNEFFGEVAPIASSDDADLDAFRIVPGLNGQAGAISFESVAYPGHYLRHQNFQLKLHRERDQELYRNDASFLPRAGLSGTGSSFESVNYPGYFIHQRDFDLHIDRSDGSGAYNGDATFVQVSSL